MFKLAGKLLATLALVYPVRLFGQTVVAPPPATPVFTEGDHLRGGWGPYRANNKLISYHLSLRVDPLKKYISGHNDMEFRMLTDGSRIQMELVPTFQIDKILLVTGRNSTTPLKWERAAGRTVYIDAPKPMKAGETHTIQFFYSGSPVEMGRFGGIVFRQDPAGRPLVNTACEEEGASVWWPNKDQWREEPEHVELSIDVPNDLVEISGGRLQAKTDLHDGFTRWDWKMTYPINNYDVSLNVGKYVHFGDRYGDLTLDYWVFPEDLDKAQRQFVQVKGMLKAYEHIFGAYPFPRDGYKLVEALYSGVENQTAITYGNHFENGYLGRPKTGIGTRFDFIIIHESAHEWFGNSITAADRSDMWIHEGWANYCETVFVEYMWGKADGLTYLNTGKQGVKNVFPVISQESVASTPPADQYKKGALLLNTVRSILDDDALWYSLLHDYYQHFKYQTIMTTDMVAFFNQRSGKNLTAVFDEYLRHAAIPTLQLRFDPAAQTVQYRWIAGEASFAMPIRVGDADHWTTIRPNTKEWQTMPTKLSKDTFEVPTDLYYINVDKS